MQTIVKDSRVGTKCVSFEEESVNELPGPILIAYVDIDQDENDTEQDCNNPIRRKQTLNRNEINHSSKIGGRPLWLIPHSLPEDLYCRFCRNLLVFLLQLYAPQNTANAFHRVLYVFVCWTCGRDNRLYRAQLQRSNTYYPDTYNKLSAWQSQLLADNESLQEITCLICGLPVCDKREHKRCESARRGFTKACFIERRLYIETEEDWSREIDDDDIENRLLHHIQNGVKVEEVLDGAEESENDEDERDPDPDPSNHEEDNVLSSYISHMNGHFPHVVRYGAPKPIWFCKKGVLQPTSVPPCDRCGAPRRFEFQVHSTILDHLEALDNLEVSFGTLCCYTCSLHCSTTEEMYIPEFVYKQRDTTMDNPVWRQL